MPIHDFLPGAPAISHHPGHNLQLKHQAIPALGIFFFNKAQENTLYGATTEICCAREPFWRLQTGEEMSMQELHLKFPNSGLSHALGKAQQCFKLIFGVQETLKNTGDSSGRSKS